MERVRRRTRGDQIECPRYDEDLELIEGNSSRVERRSPEKILKLEVAKDGEAEN